MRNRVALLVVGFTLVRGGGLWAAEAPATGSPGSAGGTVIGDACPTFSWGIVQGARSYDLVVYQVDEKSEDTKPVLRQSLPGSLGTWTPALDRCLEQGGRYAWSVRTIGRKEASPWSPPSLFQVASGRSAAEVRAVLRRYLDGGGSLDELAGTTRAAGKPHAAAAPGLPATLAAAEAAQQAGGPRPSGLFPNVPLQVVGGAWFLSGPVAVFERLDIPAAVHMGPFESGGNTGPEAYAITDQDAPSCNSTKRGSIAVLGISTGGAGDALCFCGQVVGRYEWWCFNP